MPNDHNYDALKPGATKEEVVKALLEALNFYMDPKKEIQEELEEHPEYSSPKWSPALANLLKAKAREVFGL